MEFHLADPAERRSKFFEDYASVVDRHRTRGFEYEQEAIAYSTGALKILSYLNGGGLLAMPTAVALFHASIDKVKILFARGSRLLCCRSTFYSDSARMRVLHYGKTFRK